MEFGKGRDFQAGRACIQPASFPPGPPREALPDHHRPQEAASQADQMEHSKMCLHDGHLLVRVLQQRRLGRKEPITEGSREGGGRRGQLSKMREGVKEMPSKQRGRREAPLGIEPALLPALPYPFLPPFSPHSLPASLHGHPPPQPPSSSLNRNHPFCTDTSPDDPKKHYRLLLLSASASVSLHGR